MQELIIIFGLVTLSALSAFAISLKPYGIKGFHAKSSAIAHAVQAEVDHPTHPDVTIAKPSRLLIADAPPPEDSGTPGQRG
jgi:hypothetical protein